MRARGWRPIALLVAAFLMFGALVATAHFPPPQAAHAAMTYKTIPYGAGYGNRTVYSNAGWYVSVFDTLGAPVATLAFRANCDLVETRYVNHVTTTTWHSNTARPAGYVCALIFQTDGNVAIYHGAPMWATGTNHGAYRYSFDIYSSGVNNIWYYVPGYGWKWAWQKP